MLYYVENEILTVQKNKNEKSKFDMNRIIGEMVEEIVFFSNGMGKNTPLFRKMREHRCDKIEFRFNWLSEDDLDKDIEEIEDRVYYRLRSLAVNHDHKSSEKFSWSIGTIKTGTVALVMDFK